MNLIKLITTVKKLRRRRQPKALMHHTRVAPTNEDVKKYYSGSPKMYGTEPRYDDLQYNNIPDITMSF